MDPIDIINLIPPQWHAYLLLAITATTLAMPLLEWVANKTACTWDNALVARLQQLLALVPRIGLGNRQRAAETVARTSKRPPPPLACVFAVLLLGGCASWADAKPVLRDVNDIARELCEATMGAEAKREGVRVEDLCLLPYVFAPFLQAQHLASANAVLGRELPMECAP